ncbi:hypothetical protein HYH03_010101 [Edaphochlamys debaryana]|uniref:Uncharacterized protein n=1 Tax=Edaphochlamys debaryana TaxID=47281 RepID=A0A835XYT7_9CHLO|nr:hypothetical protein HYH03_010101 [Edaphochlamys debaryana]|eukprot:KAG2491528.1 hypothetical protein HYH03_010101 [Edaphochlamys debaryana]
MQLTDLLQSNLATSAYESLLSSLDRESLGSLRLATKSLRAVVDAHITELRLRMTCGLGIYVLWDLCRGGRWLQLWPGVRRVRLDASHSRHHPDPRRRADSLLAPFVGAPSIARQRITALVVGFEGGDELPAASLTVLLALLPGLRTLRVEALLDCNPLDQLTVGATLENLTPHLTSLSLSSLSWVVGLPTGVAARLRSLEVISLGGAERSQTVYHLACAVSRMTSLRSLTLEAGALDTASIDDVDEENWEEVEPVHNTHAFFQAELMPRLLDSLPPSLESLRVKQVELRFDNDLALRFKLTCRLASGLLTSVLVEQANELKLRLEAYLGNGLPNADAVAELLSRCDQVSLWGLVCNLEHVRSPEEALEAALDCTRLFGLPEKLLWTSRLTGVLQLRPAGSWAGSPGWSWRPPPAVVPPAAVVERALERMACSNPAGEDTYVVVSGIGALQALSLGTLLHLWVQQMSRNIVAESGWCPSFVHGVTWYSSPYSEHRITCLETLPCAGATVLTCGSRLTALKAMLAVWEQARLFMAIDPCSLGLQEAPVLVAKLASLPLDRALLQELQALWDGEQESGAGASEARGSASSGGCGWRGGTGVDRLRWLLETWEGLQALPAPEYLAIPVLTM